MKRPHGVGVTLNDFTNWLSSSQPGQILVYANCVTLGMATDEIQNVAYHARVAYAEGRVDLVQRRTETGFDYFAIKRA